MGRLPRVVTAFQPWANFHSAFSAFALVVFQWKRQFNRRRKNFAVLVASTFTVFWSLVVVTASGELVHEPGGLSCSVSCNAKPVEGAGQDRSIGRP